MTEPAPARNRVVIAACLIGVIVWGLASRRYSFLFPAAWGKYPGDALWALMIYLGYALLFPRYSPWRLAAYALATSFLVEFSQLYQSPWLNEIRETTFGRLVLGSSFTWIDLIAYTIGIACGVGVELPIRRAKRASASVD